MQSFLHHTKTQLEILDRRVLLLVESKHSGADDIEDRALHMLAWDEVREQAGYLFRKWGDQETVGVMITVGPKWVFRILPREFAVLPGSDSDSYRPGGDPLGSVDSFISEVRNAGGESEGENLSICLTDSKFFWN